MALRKENRRLGRRLLPDMGRADDNRLIRWLHAPHEHETRANDELAHAFTNPRRATRLSHTFRG